MYKNNIRLLNASEIECRIGTIGEKGVSLLLFKDARVDQKILDETYGALGWKRSHQCIDGNLYCTVEIWDNEKKQWVSKQDVGTTSYTEKEKGQASDSFKRACFNWGIGRELYTAPFIWIPAVKTSLKKKGDKYNCSDKFSVADISCNESREIVALKIVNQHGEVVYSFRQKTDMTTPQPKQKKTVGANPRKMSGAGQLEELEKELERTGVDLSAVLERYRLQDINEITQDIYESAMKGLKKTKSRTAA